MINYCLQGYEHIFKIQTHKNPYMHRNGYVFILSTFAVTTGVDFTAVCSCEKKPCSSTGLEICHHSPKTTSKSLHTLVLRRNPEKQTFGKAARLSFSNMILTAHCSVKMTYRAHIKYLLDII